MDIINIQYLLWSFNTGKIGQELMTQRNDGTSKFC